VLPRAADEFIHTVAALSERNDPHNNPAWHILAGRPPETASSPIGFTMLLNLASVSNAENPEMLWDFIRRYRRDVTPERYPFLAKLVEHAIAYCHDFIAPKKHFRSPTADERGALFDLAGSLRELPEKADAETIQNLVYAVGKRHAFTPLKAWFDCLYQVLLGQEEGPRFGGFIALYGIERTVRLIENALAPAVEA
jgi:lysyl-tRNA synthetase class 1